MLGLPKPKLTPYNFKIVDQTLLHNEFKFVNLNHYGVVKVNKIYHAITSIHFQNFNYTFTFSQNNLLKVIFGNIKTINFNVL
jgi:hypothetical protein